MVRSAPFVILLALLPAYGAPKGTKQWSKRDGVGVWFPRTWKVVARDRGPALFVVEGPLLGRGRPRVALQRAGAVGERRGEEAGLDALAKRLVAEVAARPGWTVTVSARRRVGCHPAVRAGFTFRADDTSGRARITVVLLGDAYYVLEMSAHASHFPGATFDRIEASLDVRWREHQAPGPLTLRIPAGWRARNAADGSVVVDGPPMHGRRSMVRFRETTEGVPESAGPGEKIEFFGGKRETRVDERAIEGRTVRMLLVQEAGWTAAVMLDAAAWDDLFPVAAAIVASARTGAKEKQDDGKK